MASHGEESAGDEDMSLTNWAHAQALGEAMHRDEESLRAEAPPSSGENWRLGWYQKLLKLVPRLRPLAAPRRHGFPYYAVGHDPAVSSLAGLVGPDTDDTQLLPDRTANLDPIVHQSSERRERVGSL